MHCGQRAVRASGGFDASDVLAPLAKDPYEGVTVLPWASSTSACLSLLTISSALKRLPGMA